MLASFDITREATDFLSRTCPDIDNFWSNGKETDWNSLTFLAHSDYIYTRALTGTLQTVSPDAAVRFAEAVARAPLKGRVGCEKPLLPHLSAYILGGLHLLAEAGHDYRDIALGSVLIDIDRMLDPETNLPRWPRHWSHHVWRVSHWIGGIPSILLTFARHAQGSGVTEGLVRTTLDACDRYLIDSSSGLLRPYRSVLLQQLFRTAYQLRHNPELADIGGLVHVHWVNHATSRPYKAAPALIERCMTDMERHPFLERTPYCLDFDYVQLLRTAVEQVPEGMTPEIRERVSTFSRDLTNFLRALPESGYSLHRLPGALATLHEASIILQADLVPGTGRAPLDVIKTAYWL